MKIDRKTLALTAAVACMAGSFQSAATDGSRQVCVADNGLYCFDAGDLSLRWKAPQDTSTNVVVAAGNITLTSGSNGLSAYAADGRKLWQRTDFGTTFEPRLASDAVFVGSVNGDLARLRLKTGEIVWRRQLSGWAYSPALLPNSVVTGGSAGKLHAFDRESGQLQWTRDLGQELVYRPVESNGERVVATTFDGRVTAFDADGSPVWETRFAVPAGTPVEVDGQLYSSLFDGRVVALNAADGKLAWQRRFEQPVKLAGLGEGIVAFNVDRVVAIDGLNNRFWQRDFSKEILTVLPLERREVVILYRHTAVMPAVERLRLPAID